MTNQTVPAAEEAALRLTVASLLLDQMAEQPGERTLVQHLCELGLPVTAPYTAVVLALRAGVPAEDRARAVDRVLQRHYACCSIASGGRVLTLVLSEDGFARLAPALDELCAAVREMAPGEGTIGVSRRFTELRRCAAACREAVDALRLADTPGIHHIHQLQPDSQEYPTARQQETRLDHLLFGGERRELEAYLRCALSPGVGELAMLQLLTVAQNILRSSLGERETMLLLRRCALSEPLSAALDRESLRRRLSDLCLTGYDRLSQFRRDRMGLLVQRARCIIEQRYMEEDLSLHSVSRELHVSPNYLSANMRRYAGDTFIHLLIRRRMEVARLLLCTGGMKIGEVARRCGYSDQHYFSFCFKKYYGISPARMRSGEGDDS
jgi:two-component system response regulator YesN